MPLEEIFAAERKAFQRCVNQPESLESLRKQGKPWRHEMMFPEDEVWQALGWAALFVVESLGEDQFPRRIQ